MALTQMLLAITEFRTEAHNVMEKLVARFGETVHLAALESGQVIYIGDISPRLEAGGFLSSLRGFPASRRLAWLGFHRPRSYGLSTGSNRESHGQNVLCSIDVAVMMNATCRASPRSDIKR